MTTTHTESNSEQTSCDYRNKECAAYGVVIGGRWICNNHICEQRQQCWLNGNTRVSANVVAPTVDDLLQDAGAIIIVNEGGAGARVEIRFSELEDAQRLHKALAQHRAAASTVAPAAGGIHALLKSMTPAPITEEGAG